jgi:hypothetical protein
MVKSLLGLNRAADFTVPIQLPETRQLEKNATGYIVRQPMPLGPESAGDFGRHTEFSHIFYERSTLFGAMWHVGRATRAVAWQVDEVYTGFDASGRARPETRCRGSNVQKGDLQPY